MLETAPWRGMLLSATGACCVTQPPGHSHLLDPQRTVHIAPKTELGKVQVILFKTSSLSILYTKRSVYLEVTLKEPQLRIKRKTPTYQRAFSHSFCILLLMKDCSILPVTGSL